MGERKEQCYVVRAAELSYFSDLKILILIISPNIDIVVVATTVKN